ncbi:MAG TPA: TonB-dependent receptor [Vicinamibacterales bacterium]|nr:TonB-dependent receptor [Vicinamibacterales bacterium]
MTRVVLLAMVLVAFGATPAVAQLEPGRLTGIVSDPQGAVLPGVTVTATSPSLIGKQVAVTEEDGKFLFPSLPSGTYTLTFELSSFRPVRRENIVLTLGRTFTVDMQLEVASVTETLTVTAESPLVDRTTTAVGNEFSAEKLAAVPSATDLWAALGQAPGVRMLGFDVGGSHKSQQVGYESFGIRNQNRVVTDNVDTTEGTGGAGFYQDFFAHEEVAVSAAGGDVAMNTPGSALISTIKSGGNSFKSLLNFTYEGEGFVGRNLDDANKRRGDTGQPNIIFYESHLDLGGPVIRDRVWFYTAFNRFKIDKIISGVPKFSNIAGERLQTTDLGIFNNFTAKGTYRMTDKDTLIGYYQWGEKVKPFRGLSVTTPPDSILGQDSDSWMYKGQWQRLWSNRLFTDVNVGLFGFGWPMAPNVDFQTNPPRTDLGNGLNSGAGWLAGDAGGPFTFDRHKPQITIASTYFLPDRVGSHDLKFGLEWLDDQSKFGNNGNSGPILYRDRNGGTAEIEFFDFNSFETFGTGWTGADDRNKRLAIFAQDRWSPTDRLTITLGVRFDRQQPYYAASIRDPLLTEIFEPRRTEETVLLTSNKVVPRVGVSYDPVGDNKSVIKAFYGRYYFNFADRLSNLNPGGTNSQRWTFLDPNGNRLYDGLHELGTLILTTGGTSTRMDPDLKTPYTDEFNVSYERQFWGESSLRAAYVRKQVRDEFATRVPARDGQYTIPVQRTVDISGFDTGITGQQTFTLHHIPAGLSTQNIVATIPDGEGSYDFDTIQLAFNKRFRRGLFIQSSIDYQWRDELRNASNPSTSPLVADPINTTYYQNASAFPEVGNRQKNTNWNYRLLGRYELPYRVGLAANLRVQSGWPWARRISAALPNLGTVFFFVEPIENNRSDTVTIVDLRVDKTFGLGRYRFTVIGDVFNALNSNAVTNFNMLNGTQFNRIIAPLDPRTAMLGVRFEF